MSHQTTKPKTSNNNAEIVEEYLSIERYATNKIRKIRKEQKVSLAKLSEVTGLTQQQLNKIEKGVNCLRVGLLYQQASLLNIPIASCFPATEVDANSAKPLLKTPQISHSEYADKIRKIIKALSTIEHIELLDVAYERVNELTGGQ